MFILRTARLVKGRK